MKGVGGAGGLGRSVDGGDRRRGQVKTGTGPLAAVADGFDF